MDIPLYDCHFWFISCDSLYWQCNHGWVHRKSNHLCCNGKNITLFQVWTKQASRILRSHLAGFWRRNLSLSFFHTLFMRYFKPLHFQKFTSILCFSNRIIFKMALFLQPLSFSPIPFLKELFWSYFNFILKEALFWGHQLVNITRDVGSLELFGVPLEWFALWVDQELFKVPRNVWPFDRLPNDELWVAHEVYPVVGGEGHLTL